MSNSILKAAILVVSTTASKDPSADSSGGILKDVFDMEGTGKWEVVEIKIVGDDVLDIQRSITGWTDQENAVNLIISTGGTGFAVHDSTPEVQNHQLYSELHSSSVGNYSTIAQACPRTRTRHARSLISSHSL